METERDLLGTNFISTQGSSSAIVAHNAAALGLRVRFVTVVGDDDFGRIALERLRRGGVETSGSIIDPTLTTGVTIMLPHGEVRHSLSYLGSITALTAEHLHLDDLAQARHLHISSLYLQTGLHRGIVEVLRYLKAAGLTISLDTNDDPANQWGPPLYDMLPFVDVFMPNEGEISRMTGAADIDVAISAFDSKVPTVVVKRGKRGCRVRHLGQVTEVPGIAVNPVDTIGAGDSFDAGFLYAYLKGNDPIASARAGNITGALSTLSPGGTEAFRNQPSLKSFLRQHNFPQ